MFEKLKELILHKPKKKGEIKEKSASHEKLTETKSPTFEELEDIFRPENEPNKIKFEVYSFFTKRDK